MDEERIGRGRVFGLVVVVVFSNLFKRAENMVK